MFLLRYMSDTFIFYIAVAACIYSLGCPSWKYCGHGGAEEVAARGRTS